MSNGKFKFQRGEVYHVKEHDAEGHEQKKNRWWVIVSANPINMARGTVVALPISTKAPIKPPLSLEVFFNNSKMAAVTDQIRALDKKRFTSLDGTLSLHEMSLIEDGLRQVLVL